MGKHLTRFLALPVVLTLIAIIWGGTYILSVVEMISKVVSGTILMLTIVAYLAGLASESQAFTALVAGFVFYAVPQIGRITVSISKQLNDVIVAWINE